MASSVIAAQGYTLRNFAKTPADVAAICAKIKQIGYDAVQPSGWANMAAEELAKILQGEGLVCAATHYTFDRMLGELEQVAAEHRTLGCRHTAVPVIPRMWGQPGPDYPQTAEGYGQFAKDASEVGRKLLKLGVTLSYHHHNFEFEKRPQIGGRRAIDILIEDTDPQVFNLEIDTYWVQAGGADPVAYINKCKGRIPLLHLKDMTVRNHQSIMAEVGEGNLNWPAILAAAKAAGVQWYIVEQDHCERDPFDSLGISLRNLKAMGLH